ncbi:MAG: DUF839 domain-containing protein [Planctomycetota bacterium]
MRGRAKWLLGALALLGGVGCGGGGDDGAPGIQGPQGEQGPPGTPGAAGQDGDPAFDTRRPLSSLVAVTLPTAPTFGVLPNATLPFPAPPHIPAYVKSLVRLYATNLVPADFQFPLAAATSDDVRVIAGLSHNVVVKWLDPLTWDDGNDKPRFGANCDYTAYFGDGWNADWTGSVVNSPPQWRGSGTSAWMWCNHEYVSGTAPGLVTAPSNQQLTLALWLKDREILANDVRANVWLQADVDAFIRREKRELGGSWFRIVQDPGTGQWHVDRTASAQRFDATSATQTKVVGSAVSADADDAGAALAAGVVSGTLGNCSGGQSPWGTVFSCNENVQDYYGDLEACWDSNNNFVAGTGFDPGAAVNPTIAASTADTAEFGRTSEPNQRHPRDSTGWIDEFDVATSGTPLATNEWYGKTTAGVGHRKVGVFGRARWENTTFVTDAQWKLPVGQPVVIYAADDRRGGRIFKWVSASPYTAGMTKAQVRALLDTGALYVSQFDGLDNATGLTLTAGNATPTEAAPGNGRWIRLSTASTDVAPNAAALGAGTTVGAALQSNTWNSLGGFPNDDAVRRALFTACAKIGIVELNRPEDVEWNPADPSGTPRLYVAFTNFNGGLALKANGTLNLAPREANRTDRDGAIFAMQETNAATPATSLTFAYFQVWKGTNGTGVFDASSADNLVIDRDGGVWFGTDGNFGRNARADALYYLDLDPTHKTGQPGILTPTWGKNFRVVAGPSDSEATGPCLSSDMRSLFFNAQHPGEGSTVQSTWPQIR